VAHGKYCVSNGDSADYEVLILGFAQAKGSLFKPEPFLPKIKNYFAREQILFYSF